MSNNEPVSVFHMMQEVLTHEVGQIREAIKAMTDDEFQEMIMVIAMIELESVDPNFVAARHIVGRSGNASAIMEAIDRYYVG